MTDADDDHSADLPAELPQRTLFIATLIVVIAFWGFCFMGSCIVCCIKAWCGHCRSAPAPEAPQGAPEAPQENPRLQQ